MSEVKPQKIALLLMAAGSSSRLGQPKQLVKLTTTKRPAKSLLHRQVMLMTGLGDTFNTKAYCVFGFQREVMTKHLATCSLAGNLTLINSTYWQQGLSSSIAKGVDSLADDISAVLIFLVDQWQLTTVHLASLITQWLQAPEKIVIASQAELLSPPVIFPRRYFDELKLLSGDEGAKRVIKENIAQVKRFDMPEAFIDLDTPEQLSALKNIHHS